MNVVDDLRVPDVVERVDGQLRFDLGEGVPVAVIVVAGVVVVELGRFRSFGRGAEGSVVPMRDDGHPVGILRRHEPEDHIVEDRARGGARIGSEPIRQRDG